MRKNFLVGESNELLQGESRFDLHNRYDFMSVCVGSDQVSLYFDPNQEFGNGLPSIVITFNQLHYLSISDNFFTDHLDEIGYKSKNDFDDEWLLGERQSQEGDHLFFRFIGGHSIRIFAAEAMLVGK